MLTANNFGGFKTVNGKEACVTGRKPCCDHLKDCSRFKTVNGKEACVTPVTFDFDEKTNSAMFQNRKR